MIYTHVLTWAGVVSIAQSIDWGQEERSEGASTR